MRKFRFLLFAILANIFGVQQIYGLTGDPRELRIYQVMVASFQHDPSGAPGYSAMWGPDNAIKNGNLRGIINSLDHIKDLGANAIWMTPIFDSSSAMGGEKLNATGYFTNNFFAIDPNFGTEEDLKELVDEAHKRGIYVILDGVFGHHGGVTQPSPSGYTLDVTVTESDRGPQGGTGNISYPGSLDYIKEVATYWIDKFNIDGWRLDQSYQATQGGHNYWKEIRGAVEDLVAKRKDKGEKWGVLGYMVGEDWGDADVINRGSYRDSGLVSAFDFDGKHLISGPMQDTSSAGLENGWMDVVKVLSPASSRGYLNDEVMPNLFLSNHDGYRLADHFDPADPYYYEKMMTRHAILAAYTGPITLYYGDEFGDSTRDAIGAQKDNISRTTGHLTPRSEGEKRLADYVSNAMRFRSKNPAMWRGTSEFTFQETPDGGKALVVVKRDTDSDNVAAVIFSDTDAEIPVTGVEMPVKVKAWMPVFMQLK